MHENGDISDMTIVISNPRLCPRLFVQQGLGAGSALILDATQANYLGNVMRLGAGDAFLVFNGRDGEWAAVVETLGKKKAEATLKNQTRPQEQEPGPWLAFAPLKKTRTGFLVEKATELGVSRLCPVFTRHSNSTRINLQRMRAHAIEASEQSERLSIPEIDAAKKLAPFMDGWPPDRRLLVLDERGGGEPIVQVLSSLQAASDGLSLECGFLCGPEGGFEESELATLRELDFVFPVDLGSRILRAETAALAALACWQAFLGRGHRR